MPPSSAAHYFRCKIPEFHKCDDASVEFRNLRAHGHNWIVTIVPRDGMDQDRVSVLIRLESAVPKHKFRVDFNIQLGSKSVMTVPGVDQYYSEEIHFLHSHYPRDFPRQEILDPDNEYIMDASGTLFISVELKISFPETAPQPWQQQLSTCTKQLKTSLKTMLDSPRFSDVTFVVSGKEFQLHRCILAVNIPSLCDFCAEEANQVITLDDVDADLFDAMIRHVYTGEQLDIQHPDKLISLLRLADRFNCCSVKLLAESMIVGKYLAKENAAELLVVADSHSCASLKEAAMQVCLDHFGIVNTTNGWKNVRESPQLLEELLFASNRTKYQMNFVDQMSVGELRNELLERNENIDGSRELLMKRLKALSMRSGTES